MDERLEALDKAISEQSHLLGMLAERLGSALRPEHPKANDPDNLKVAAAASPLVDRLSQFIAAAEEHNQRLIRMLDLLEL